MNYLVLASDSYMTTIASGMVSNRITVVLLFSNSICRQGNGLVRCRRLHSIRLLWGAVLTMCAILARRKGRIQPLVKRIWQLVTRGRPA